MVKFSLVYQSLVIFTLVTVIVGREFTLDGPALPDRPFVTVWNAPSGKCDQKFGIKVNLSHFDIVQNPEDQFAGEFMTIFYNLGFFPRILPNETVINGGIPQVREDTLNLA